MFLIQYATWPLVVLIIAIIFRDRIGKVSGLKFSNYEVFFKDELESIKTSTGEACKKLDATLTSTQFLKLNMMKMAEQSPLAVILQAWGIMEYTVLECAKHELKTTLNSASAAVQLLHDNDNIREIQLMHFFRLLALVEKCKYESNNNAITKNYSLEISDLILSVADSIKETAELTSKQAETNIEAKV